jgi:hypothetical protein
MSNRDSAKSDLERRCIATMSRPQSQMVRFVCRPGITRTSSRDCQQAPGWLLRAPASKLQ